MGSQFSNFADTTSAHGFLQIGNSKGLLRCLWIFVVVVGWSGMLFMSHLVLDGYLKYPSQTDVRYIRSTNAEFPAVTFCNLNPVRNSKYQEMAKGLRRGFNSLDPKVIEAADILKKINECMVNSSNAKPVDVASNQTDIELALLANLYKFGDKAWLQMGHQLNHMLLDCVFQRRYACTKRNITQWQHGVYGNCYTLRISTDDFPGIGTGEGQGLKMEFLIEPEDYLDIGSGIGIRFMIHPTDQYPFLGDYGISLATGAMTTFAVRKSEFKRLPLPYDGTNCAAKDTHTIYSLMGAQLNTSLGYSVVGCFESCMLEHSEQLCGCVNSHMTNQQLMTTVFGKVVRPCDQSAFYSDADVKCYMRNIFRMDLKSKCNEKCLQSCHTMHFDSRITSETWPSAKYMETLLKKWINLSPDLQGALVGMVPKVLQSGGLVSTMTGKTKRRKRDLSQLSGPEIGVADPTAKITSPSVDEITAEMPELLKELVEVAVENIVRKHTLGIQVYFEDLNVHTVEELPEMSLYDLLSSVGGTFGLFVGISFLTLVELIVFMCKLVVCCKKKPAVNPTKPPNKSPGQSKMEIPNFVAM